jgi:hypothetical protein
MDNNIAKLEKAYFVSHNGLGDNITNSGAVNFLLQYYETIHFLCKDTYLKNVEYLFADSAVIPVPFDSNNEFSHIKHILNNVTDDIFVSGCHKEYVQKRITHPALLTYKQDDQNYTIDYHHIRTFYYDIGLDISIYYNYFNIKSTDVSKKYYEPIKDYKIIFIHSKSSRGEVNYNNVYETYKDNTDYIMICTNKNMYNKEHAFYEIADKYVNLYVTLYIDIINNAELFFMVDSCFCCIVYPLMMMNRISKDNVHVSQIL